jgi:hypothetical protein
MSNNETYDALLTAVQNYISDLDGDDVYARDWILVAGVEPVKGFATAATRIVITSSPRTTRYTVTGLLDWASDAFMSSDYE